MTVESPRITPPAPDSLAKTPTSKSGHWLRRTVQHDDQAGRLAEILRGDDPLPEASDINVEHLVEADDRDEPDHVDERSCACSGHDLARVQRPPLPDKIGILGA
jgi:hypothetical protein